jgi:hypothetical protein
MRYVNVIAPWGEIWGVQLKVGAAPRDLCGVKAGTIH